MVVIWQIPSSWRPVLEDSETLQIFFFYYYAVTKAPLSKEVSKMLSFFYIQFVFVCLKPRHLFKFN